MLITGETVLCCLFALAEVWLLMFGLHKKALAYILVYAALWAVLFPLREMQIVCSRSDAHTRECCAYGKADTDYSF